MYCSLWGASCRGKPDTRVPQASCPRNQDARKFSHQLMSGNWDQTCDGLAATPVRRAACAPQCCPGTFPQSNNSQRPWGNVPKGAERKLKYQFRQLHNISFPAATWGGIFSSPFYRWKAWGSENLNHLPKVTKAGIAELALKHTSVGLHRLTLGDRVYHRQDYPAWVSSAPTPILSWGRGVKEGLLVASSSLFYVRERKESRSRRLWKAMPLPSETSPLFLVLYKSLLILMPQRPAPPSEPTFCPHILYISLTYPLPLSLSHLSYLFCPESISLTHHISPHPHR